MENKKKCLTCVVKSEDGNNISIDNETVATENKIPQWYKETGNYSLLPRILNCEDKYNANDNDLIAEVPDITGTEVRVPINDEKLGDKWIFYWAANPSKNSLVIKTPKEAYNKNENRGLLKLNEKGYGEMILNCPQPYKVNGVTYPGHVHFVSLKEDKTWDMNVLTKDIICYIDDEIFKEAFSSRDHILVNASEIEDKDIKSINISPESLNISNKKKKLILEIKKDKDTKKKLERVEILDVPIVLYTTSNNNEEVKVLLNHFLESGFSNITLYKKGDNKVDDNKVDDNKVVDNKVDDNKIFNIKKDKTEKLIIVKDNENIVYDHDIETGRLTFNKDNKDIFIGTWDGKMPINWDSNEDAIEIKHEHSEIYDKGQDDDTSDEDTSDDDTSDEDTSDEEPEKEEPKKEQPKKEEPKKEEPKKEEPKKEQNGGNNIDRVKLKKLKVLLSGGGEKEKEKTFKKEKITLKSTNDINDKSIQENFRGWGYTFFK